MTERQKIFANQRALKKMLTAVSSERSLAKQLWMCDYVLPYAKTGGHGCYASDVLEKVYVTLARTLHVKASTQYEPNTCLIVMGRFWEYGGHIRVVERWMAADCDRKYSAVFTVDDASKRNGRFDDLVQARGGKVNFLSQGTLEEKSLELRALASQFETVLLMADTEDPIPLVAFGTEEFKRPVGLYNHGDHLFWLGVSIADIVADMRIWGQEFTLRHRGVRTSMIVTVPAETHEIKTTDKSFAREKLGLPHDSKIVITVGRQPKYVSANGKDFIDIIRPILLAEPNVFFLGVGMTLDDFPAWRKLVEEFPGRIRADGCVPHETLYPYYFASDLAIDSYPFNGITAMADATVCGCPVVSLANDVDWIVQSPAHCESIDILVRRALLLLHSQDEATRHLARVRRVMDDLAGPKCFKRQIDAFLEKLAVKSHNVREFTPVLTDGVQFDYTLLASRAKSILRFRTFAMFATLRPRWLGRFLLFALSVGDKCRRIVKYGHA